MYEIEKKFLDNVSSICEHSPRILNGQDRFNKIYTFSKKNILLIICCNYIADQTFLKNDFYGSFQFDPRNVCKKVNPFFTRHEDFVEFVFHLMHSSSSLQCKFFLYYGLFNLPCSQQPIYRRGVEVKRDKQKKVFGVSTLENKTKTRKTQFLHRGTQRPGVNPIKFKILWTLQKKMTSEWRLPVSWHMKNLHVL